MNNSGSIRSENSHSAKRKKQQKHRVVLYMCAVILLAVVITAIILILSGCAHKSSSAGLLSGTFVYDENTEYEFDGEGNGCMFLENEYRYEYKYSVSGDTLMLDFKADEVHDATYTFNLDNDKLTLTGGEGTTGGTYVLTKKELNPKGS